MIFTRSVLIVLSVFLSAGFAGHARADIFGSERSGPYLGVDLGIAIQSKIDLNASDNDVPTRCDQILRGAADTADDMQFSNTSAASLSNRTPQTGCARGDSWDSGKIKIGTGVIAGVQAGYMFGNFRAEAEYLYRAHPSGGRADTAAVTGDKDAELVGASQGLENLSSHSLFANIYYDFTNESDFTPYLGAGAGWSRISTAYTAIFTRNHDPDKLNAGKDAEDPGRNTIYRTPDIAAGTTTHTSDGITDTVFGWQLTAGSDYEIDKNWSIGLKLRYSRFGKVKGGDRWDQLRSHESAISAPTDDDYKNKGAFSTEEIRNSDPGLAGFNPEVVYKVETDSLSVWSAALNLKYKFGGGSGAGE